MTPRDSHSHWIDTVPLPAYPRLDKNLDVDVVVVGGGITGITAAFLLKESGKTVALLERDRCACADTGHTTAHLTAVIDTPLTDLKKTFGADGARAVWDAGAAARDQVVKLIRAHDIDCGFSWVPGYTHLSTLATSKRTAKDLQEEAATARELGILAEYSDSIPFFRVPGVKFPHQAVFHPRKYLAALLNRIHGSGSHVFENTSMDEVEDDKNVAKPAQGFVPAEGFVRIRAGAHRIRCRHLVLATHNPLVGESNLLGATFFQTKLALYTSFAAGGRIPRGSIPVGSYWDTADPYFYLRVERGGSADYAILGGLDHKTGQRADIAAVQAELDAKFRELVPLVEIDSRWMGQVIETHDGLPYIGAVSDRQFIATGFSGNGMTFGTLGAMMAADAILKRPNPWKDLFDPGRKAVHGGIWSYISENADYPYYLVRDRLARSEGGDVEALKPGEGRILSLDGRKVAAYRSDAGKVSLCSPVCTHLQCIVRWNDGDKTWDCPCHGSRFRPNGDVLSGPAEEPLARLDKS